MKCVLADDEPIARQLLAKYIEQVPDLELVAQCKDAFEVLDVLKQTQVDVLFLDINMPKLSGLSLVKSLVQKPAIIFTTAYAEFAVEGFELSATDYLLKPFSFERFMQAVLKVKQQQPAAKSMESTPAHLFVKSDKKLVKVLMEQITHVEAYGNYIKIFENEMVLSPQTLTDFHAKLSDNFIRIHKSFLLNLNAIKLIEGNQVVLSNDSVLPIGKNYRKLLLERL